MDNILNSVAAINDKINGLVWGWPALILLGLTGVLMTCLTKFFQISHIGHWMRQTIGAIFKDKNVTGHTKDRTISQFQSLCTALAATVGTGNIVGVAGAIAIGGPGAVFWMWLIAFFGMMTNYSENVLGILFRRKNPEGEWQGGAMYYLRDGLGAKKGCKGIGTVLAVLFSIFCLLASFGIGNMSQVNSMVSNVNTAFGIPNLVTGIILFVMVAAVVVGGLKRIAAMTEKIVPFMVIIYLIGSLVIVFINIGKIPAIMASIFQGAFHLKSAAGGLVGAGIATAMKMGFKRGVFSNEAGLGSSVMVHSSSNVKEPVRQGMWGIFEVFADTIIVCTLTAIVVLSSGVVDLQSGQAYEVISYPDATGKICEMKLEPKSEEARLYIDYMDGTDEDPVLRDEYAEQGYTWLESASYVSYAFSNVFGSIGSAFVAIAILLFAYSTVLGWSHYGTTACRYLFGEKGVWPYRILFCIIVLLGSMMKAKLAWDISDTFNGLMMLPNLIGVVVLSPLVMKCTKNYVDRKFHHLDVKPMYSAFADVQAAQEKAKD